MIKIKLFKYIIVITENVVDILKRHKQDKEHKHEAGGILLGQVKDDKIYILRVSKPNKFDKSTRYSFIRSKEIAQIIVDHEFENSDRKTIYLGEWHTHPESTPSPSGRDIKMIIDQKRLGKLNEDFILLLIQGTEQLYIRMYKGKEWQEIIL